MSKQIKYDRRRFLGIAAMSMAAAEFGMIDHLHRSSAGHARAA